MYIYILKVDLLKKKIVTLMPYHFINAIGIKYNQLKINNYTGLRLIRFNVESLVCDNVNQTSLNVISDRKLLNQK